MAAQNYHYTLLTTLHILLLLPHPISTLNITQSLSHFPNLSIFTSLLTSNIFPDLTHRSSLTILAVPNSYFPPSYTSSLPPSAIADVIRYHILLQYFTLPDLRRVPASGTLVATLLQTTGRAPDNSGSLNVTFNSDNGVVSFHSVNNSSISADVISLVETLAFNISIISVDSMLGPLGVDLMAAENRPPPPGLNITRALIGGHDFNVAASMLFASGVVDEFEADERGAGITLFVPTDMAFANLEPNVKFQSLTADRKVLVLKFHVLHSYYPLGSLESIVNPVQPTLATEDNGAGSFTLNISRVNGSVAINTGIVQAVVTQTVFDQNPVAIFGVSSVLLPREIFGDEKNKGVDLGKGSGGGIGPFVGAQPPEIGTTPESSTEGGAFGGPASHLLSPPEVSSGAGWRLDSSVLLCIAMLLYIQKDNWEWREQGVCITDLTFTLNE